MKIEIGKKYGSTVAGETWIILTKLPDGRFVGEGRKNGVGTPFIRVFNELGNDISGTKCGNQRMLVSLDSPVLVPLNTRYIAEVSQSGIQVGCQIFPLSVIDDLVKARNSILEIKDDYRYITPVEANYLLKNRTSGVEVDEGDAYGWTPITNFNYYCPMSVRYRVKVGS